jgi:pyruvate/2-oxoglutarate/acetoin dehydrogenase E1 component
MLEHKNLLSNKGLVPEEDYTTPFGQARIARAGKHVTAVGVALTVQKCVQAAEVLAKQGIEVEVIDPRSTSPLDIATILQSVKKTGRLMIVDDAFEPCGFGAEVSAQVGAYGFDDLDAPIRRLSGAFAPTPYSPPLEQEIVPSVETITKALYDLVKE